MRGSSDATVTNPPSGPTSASGEVHAPSVRASLTFAGGAAHAAQALVPAQSTVGFTAKQMGVPLQGQFKKFDAKLNFDTAKPEASSIRFSVDTGSATLGSKETDAELPKAEWFNVAKFPQATFDSTAVKALGETADKAALAPLADALVDPNPAIQFRAQESLRAVSGRDYGNNVQAWREYAKTGTTTTEEISFAERIRRSIF